MTSEGIRVTVFAIIGFLFFGALLYGLIFRRDFAKRFGDTSKIPWSYWGGEDSGAEGLLILMVPIMFLIFSCFLCFLLYGFVRHLQQ